MLSNLPNVTHADKMIQADVASCTLLLYPKTLKKHLVNICTWHAWKFKKVSACLWIRGVDRWVTDWNVASFMLCKCILMVLEVSKVSQLKWHPYWEACFQPHSSAAEPQAIVLTRQERVRGLSRHRHKYVQRPEDLPSPLWNSVPEGNLLSHLHIRAM